MMDALGLVQQRIRLFMGFDPETCVPDTIRSVDPTIRSQLINDRRPTLTKRSIEWLVYGGVASSKRVWNITIGVVEDKQTTAFELGQCMFHASQSDLPIHEYPVK